MMKISINGGQVLIEGLPNSCPFCHKSITPNPLFGYKKSNAELAVLMYCPDIYCKSAFLGYYSSVQPPFNTFNYRNKVSQGTIINKKFSETIKSVSEKFGEIYNQAFSAEQQDLLEICGVGYRKALEFLIKDYVISKNPNKKSEIEKMQLGNCIKDFVEDNRIKGVSKRASWLGNDETHYVRKWEGNNLSDLKKLIDLTLHWIEMEKLTEAFEIEMPEN